MNSTNHIRMENEFLKNNQKSNSFESSLLNLSIKDIQNIYKENKILKDSLKELKSREILLIAKLDSWKENTLKADKENRIKIVKTNKWGNELNEMEELQKEINNSLMELEKSQSNIKKYYKVLKKRSKKV